MSIRITTPDNAEAYDLLFAEHLTMLSTIEQETMQRAIMNSSQLWMAMNREKIVALWGLIPPTLMSDMAYLWLYTTPNLPGHTIPLLRRSRHAVQRMLRDYPTLVGHCACDAKRSQQWLHWLGAEFDAPKPDIPFIAFTIKAKQQWQQDSAQSA